LSNRQGGREQIRGAGQNWAGGRERGKEREGGREGARMKELMKCSHPERRMSKGNRKPACCHRGVKQWTQQGGRIVWDLKALHVQRPLRFPHVEL